MSKFTKTTLKKISSHLERLKSSSRSYKDTYSNSKNKNLIHTNILFHNKILVKQLLIESNCLNLENLKLSNKKISLGNKILIINKKLFINKNLYKRSYLINRKQNETNYSEKKVKYLIERIRFYLKRNLEKLISSYKVLKENNKKITGLNVLFNNKKAKQFSTIIKIENIKKWYIYAARFVLISSLHFIPFIQLITTLFYNQPNKQIVHPILSYLFNFTPFLVPIINITTPILNQDTISFLLLVPYLYFFIYSFRKYNISRKIAYQGSFALALMLFRYSLILSQEAVSVVYKFAKRLFFLKKYKNIDLLRDDITFYVEDLEDMRSYREDFFQLGESIFSLEDTTNITKLWESTTLLSLLGVIALLYNYMYFIFRGQKPIIPVVTKTVQRMMIDRKGKES